MSDTRHALAALLPCPFCGNSKGLAVANENPQDLSGGYFIACPSCDASTGLRFACGEDPIPLLIEQWNRRAALSAQPVAGAVAKMAPVQGWPAGIPWSLHLEAYAEYCKRHGTQPALIDLEGRNCRGGFGVRELDSFIPGWRDRCGEIADLKAEVARLNALLAAPQPQAAPAPEPSAQAVMTELEQRLIEIAKALPPMTTLGWNDGGMCEPDEAIKGYTKKQVLEILAQHLSASPQPEPSAQGEPVATVTEEMVTAYLTANDAYWKRIDGEPTKLGKWRNGTPSEATRISLMAALASAPSTPPPEVVEAVPLEIDYDALITAAFKLHRYRQGTGACIAFKRGAEWMRDQVGIAPKAAQP